MRVVKSNGRPGCCDLEEATELGEVECRALAFDAEQRFERGCIIEPSKQVVEIAGGGFVGAAGIVIAEAPHEQRPLVRELGADNCFGKSEAGRGVGESEELGFA